MAGRRNPFEEIEEMMNRMSRQFEQSMGGPDIRQWTGGGGGSAIDVADHDEEFVVTADLPGFEKEDIDVSLRGDELRIHAEHEEATEEGEEGRYLRKERRHQSVNRSVTLPESVDEENVSARHQNGVLTVTLPKRQGEDDSHRIDVS